METKVLRAKGGSTRAFKEIILKVIEATKDGWEPYDNFNTVFDCRMIGGTHFYVKMQRGVPDALEETDTTLEHGSEGQPEEEVVSEPEADLIKEQAEAMAERVAQINAAKTKKALDELANRFLYEVRESDKKPLGKYRRVLLEQATATV